jgi:hypothetical protein
MNVSGDWNRSDRVLQRQVSLPLHNDGSRMGWRLAAGMTRWHRRLSAVLSHVMAALALGFCLHETGQQTRHRRCHCPQQNGTQHNGSSYAVHSHEFMPLSIAQQQTGYRLVEQCAVTTVTGSCRLGHLKGLCCWRPAHTAFALRGTWTYRRTCRNDLLHSRLPVPPRDCDASAFSEARLW